MGKMKRGRSLDTALFASNVLTRKMTMDKYFKTLDATKVIYGINCLANGNKVDDTNLLTWKRKKDNEKG
jgi:hypothetical protein